MIRWKIRPPMQAMTPLMMYEVGQVSWLEDCNGNSTGVSGLFMIGRVLFMLSGIYEWDGWG